MDYKLDELLSVGEFAELLHTTKATLRHYDTIGVLKPVAIGDNGYRYYHPDQAQIFLVVLLFSECGLQLRDIKSYIKTFNSDHGKALLKSAEQTVNETIHKLTQVSKLLEGKRTLFENSTTHCFWAPFISELPERLYFKSNRLRSVQWQKTHTAHSVNISRYVMEHGEFPQYPFISRSRVEHTSNLFTLVDDPEKDNDVEICTHPAGVYVSLHCKGVNYTVEDAIGSIMKYADSNGYELAKDLYIVDTINFVITQNADEYASMFFMQVIKAQDPEINAIVESYRSSSES